MGEYPDRANRFNRSCDFCRGSLWAGGDEHVDMVGHDFYLLQCPPVCGAGFGYDVATCYFDFPGENLVPVFGAEDDVVAKFIDLVIISLHIHKTYVSIRGMSTTKSKTAQRRESIVNATPQRTLVLSLDITPEQYEIFDGLAESYNRMWGSLVSWCNNNHSINRTRMQKENYARLRAEYPELPSQFVCIAMRDAAGAVRSWNSNHPKRQWNLKASRKKKTINYDLRVMSLRGNLLSLSATRGEKRQRILLPDIPDWFDSRYPERSLNAAKLVLNPDGHSASIMLIYRLPQPALVEQGDVLGVDLGQHSLFMDSRGGETSYSHMQGVKRRYAHNRKTLQEKGTRSAHRRLKAMGHREERFIRDTNHRASKQLANTPNVSVIAFEDLAYIRRQARKGTKTGRARRNMLNQWPFSQLHEFTAYKAARNGIRTVMVDPAYTSQKCNHCGYVDARNRDHARFDCLRCGHSDNADHNAALNIRDRATQNLG